MLKNGFPLCFKKTLRQIFLSILKFREGLKKAKRGKKFSPNEPSLELSSGFPSVLFMDMPKWETEVEGELQPGGGITP